MSVFMISILGVLGPFFFFDIFLSERFKICLDQAIILRPLSIVESSNVLCVQYILPPPPPPPCPSLFFSSEGACYIDR